MARSLNGSSQRFLNASAAPLTGGVCTIAARVNLSSTAGTQWVAFYGNDSGRDGNYIDVSGAVFRAVTIDSGGTAGVAAHGTSLSTGTLYGVAATFASATSRTIYVNSLTPVANTDDIPIGSGQSYTSVGFRYRASVDSTLWLAANLIQDVAFWNAALTANEVAAFMAGVSPHFIRPASLKEYFPMLNSETSGGNTTGLVGTRMVLTQAGSPPLVNPAPTLPILRPRFGLASVTGGAAGNTTGVGAADGSSAATATGKSTARSAGDAAGTSTASAISTFGNYGAAAGSSTATAVGASTARSAGTAAGSSRARGIAPGGASVVGSAPRRSSGGGRTFRGRRLGGGGGGSVAVNPSPPADPIAGLLATMAVGELKLLSNTSYNLKTGPGGLVSAGEASAVDGDLYYNRARWDAGHPGSYTFADDLAVMNYIDGNFGDGTGDLSSVMLYSGVAYDAARKLICMIAPGGHSNGGHTGGLSFDVEAACQAILDGAPNGTGAGKREKWQALCDPMPLSAADVSSAGQYKHANWDGMADYLDGPTRGFRWPQPVVNAVLGPANTVGPYSMHTYSAITYHPGTDEIWISGYTPGPLESDYSSVPGASWIYGAATKAYTKITTFTGSDAPSFLAPPDGDSSVMLVGYHSGGANWGSLLTAAPYTLTLRSNQGTGDAFESDAAPFWVEGFATAGKWSILRMSTTSGKFNAHPDVWPLGTTTSASLVPSTGYSGDTRLFGGLSGYFYDEVDKLIYAICDNGAGGGYAVKCQTIDMWQGNPTVQATWAIAEVTMSGDTFGAAGANFETRSGFDNKVINLGPTYRAALIVTYPGQVRLFKYAA